MESKKLKTVISAEEEHLVAKSIKTTKKIAKKVSEAKTETKSAKIADKSETSGTTDTDIKNETLVSIDDFTEVATKEKDKKKGKSKKSKKHDYDSQNISVKSSFNKFDALQKRSLIHVRSSDSSKAQELFSSPQDEQLTNCRQCQKPVYKMEETIVQFNKDKGIYHKSCMRCKDCAKQLKFDNYQSHEGNLYCAVHFKL